MGRGLIALLVLSLAANVFLGGFVAGRFLGKPPHETAAPIGEHGPRGGGRGERFAHLSPEAREAMREIFQARRDLFREHRMERRELQRALHEAMIAEPWNREAVELAMAALREKGSEHHEAQNKVLLDALENLSLEDRKALADMQNKRRHKRGGRRGGPSGFE